MKELKKEQEDVGVFKQFDIKQLERQPTKQIEGTSFTDTIKLQWEKFKGFMSKDDYLFPYNNVLLKLEHTSLQRFIA